MYKCRDCGLYFEHPFEYVETHGFRFGPVEHWSVCPECGSSDFDEDYIVEREEAQCTL